MLTDPSAPRVADRRFKAERLVSAIEEDQKWLAAHPTRVRRADDEAPAPIDPEA
jgi:hypothetical protein